MSKMIELAFSGPGVVIPQMIGIGVGSWIARALLMAIGKGQIAKMIDVSAVLICVLLVMGCISNVLGKIF